MNNRLTIHELITLLAEYTGKNREDAELFLKEFISIVTNNLYADKLVKVKGLGTFKVILVDKRESIHVNTGERFLIPEHYKFSFLPDKDLKELVNKPFSFFETTEINSDADFSDTEESEEEVDSDEETIEEVMPDQEIPVVDAVVTPPILEESASPEPSEEIVLPPEPLEEISLAPEPTEIIEEEREPEPVEEQPREPLPFDDDFAPQQNASSPLKLMIVSVFILALVLIGGLYVYLALPNMKTMYPSEIIETEELEMPIDSTLVEVVEEPDSVIETGIAETEIAETVEEPVAKPKPEPATSKKEILAKVKIEQGNRLTLISLEYYGSKVFWVYLYQHNKNVISNPNNVPIGTVIEVPAPEIYGIDVRDKASVAKAAALQTEILAEK